MRRSLSGLLVCAATLWGCLFSIALRAADADSHLIAIGQVDGATGNLVSSADSIEATSFTCARVGAEVGHYRIVIQKPGVTFLSNFRNRFLVQVTPVGLADTGIVTRAIATPSGTTLTIHVVTCNAEDLAYSDDNTADPRDASFYFAVYMNPQLEPVPPTTKFLSAIGKVGGDGTLLSSAAVDLIAVESSRARRVTGDYQINLRKTGGFTGAVADDFVILVSVQGGTGDDVVAKGVVETLNDDLVSLRIRTDDAQYPGMSFAQTTPEDTVFFFTIYQIPSTIEPGPGKSRLLAAMGQFSGSTLVDSVSFVGGTFTPLRNDVGDYSVIIDAPGAFAGASSDQFVLQLCSDDSPIAPGQKTDRSLNGAISIPTDDRIVLDVTTNDLEQGGQFEGVPLDSGFYFFIYDTVGVEPADDASALFQPDLRIGAKRNLSRHRGDNLHNGSASGQTLRMRLRGRHSMTFYLSLENDGNLLDNFNLATRRPSRKVKTRYLRLTGGKSNITAALIRHAVTEFGIPPSGLVLYQAKVKYRQENSRPRMTLRFQASSASSPSTDVNQAKLIPR